MFEKGSKINSILGFKCPRCHKADLFPTKILSFKGWFKMNDTCSNCGQKYTLEPGFYWGAMYIGYLLSVVLIFTFFALFFFVFGFGVDVAFLLVMVVIFFLYAFIFRLSRAIWINMHVHYKEDALK